MTGFCICDVPDLLADVRCAVLFLLISYFQEVTSPPSVEVCENLSDKLWNQYKSIWSKSDILEALNIKKIFLCGVIDNKSSSSAAIVTYNNKTVNHFSQYA